MGARKLSYHVPSIRGYDEKSLKKITLFSKVYTRIFSVFYPKNRLYYSPFGMLPCSEYSELPNRYEASNEYRYGFQGQELDNEIKGEGNSLNYKYRMHDPRIGRFFAVDPLAPKYPHNSPYAFRENIVIHGVEFQNEGVLDTKERNQAIGNLYQEVDPSEAIFGETIITCGDMHTAVYFGTSSDGTVYAFSKLGPNLAPVITPVGDVVGIPFNGLPNYGYVSNPSTEPNGTVQSQVSTDDAPMDANGHSPTKKEGTGFFNLKKGASEIIKKLVVKFKEAGYESH